jgi:exodeoxyribonuclease-3
LIWRGKSENILMECKWNQSCTKKGFLEWLDEESLDILCIQETKAHKEQLGEELISPEGYHTYFNSGERKGYSGTAVYTKKQPNKIWTGLPDERFNNEGRTQVLEFDEYIQTK